MSSLIFFLTENQVFVATDTLAVSGDGKPQIFTSKAHYLPHLKLIIAGTGLAGFSNEWQCRINNRMAVSGILNLNFHAPAVLNEMWAKSKIDLNFPKTIVTTAYHFGISESDGKFIGFAYRSVNNFASEPLGYGTGVKPECTIPTGDPRDSIKDMMNEQRSIQEMRPKDERLFIGGEINCIQLSHKGCVQYSEGVFHDYDENLEQIFNNI